MPLSASKKKNILWQQQTNLTRYGAQNEVYNDDWVKSGLIVLYFS